MVRGRWRSLRVASLRLVFSGAPWCVVTEPEVRGGPAACGGGGAGTRPDGARPRHRDGHRTARHDGRTLRRGQSDRLRGQWC